MTYGSSGRDLDMFIRSSLAEGRALRRNGYGRPLDNPSSYTKLLQEGWDSGEQALPDRCECGAHLPCAGCALDNEAERQERRGYPCG